jgi:uncharacterized protein YndB with AHSA1/START domain
MNNPINIEMLVDAPLDQVWNFWNEPEHVKGWNAAHPAWHSPSASNDLREGGAFSYRMEARDGSMGFDFEGSYTEVRPNESIAYTMGDGRRARVEFSAEEGKTRIRESFEAEGQNPREMQQAGWQSILENFAVYATQRAQR